MPAVPANTAKENIHRNNRSKTMATNFQSSFTCAEVVRCEEKKEKRLRDNVKDTFATIAKNSPGLSISYGSALCGERKPQTEKEENEKL